jgi:hypothetical protein
MSYRSIRVTVKVMVKVNLSVCLIKNHFMNMDGGLEVELLKFLTSVLRTLKL